MGRRQKQEKARVNVVVDGRAVQVTLFPPTAPRRSWFAYWTGLVASKSTGQRRLEDAVTVAENMLRNGGDRARVDTMSLSDEEFWEIQRRHFGRQTDDRAKKRAKKSLDNCLDALAAFSEVTGLCPITVATPDHCANFQRAALTLPNNWRRCPPERRRPAQHYSERSRERRRRSGELDPLDGLPCYSPNNVLRWSRSLQAAFERANRNALKRKCVRRRSSGRQTADLKPLVAVHLDRRKQTSDPSVRRRRTSVVAGSLGEPMEWHSRRYDGGQSVSVVQLPEVGSGWNDLERTPPGRR